jgi:DNA repair exonuclease SbcCD ATPase subunit
MKLNKLRIQRFRNILDTTLDTGGARFVVLRGANRNGKTSVAEGLSLALTNTTWGLSAKGDGYVRKIKRGETKAELEAELQTASKVIKRTVTLNVNSTGRTQESEDVNDSTWNPRLFEKLLTDKKTAFDIGINTRAFQSMVYSRDEDAQKNLLASLVLPARHEFEKDTIADVENVLGEGVIDFNGEPFAVIGKAYKKLFDERASVNKKVKDFVLPVALTRPQGVNSESLKTQLASLREERTKQAGERDGAAKQANEAALKRDRANAKIETLTAVLNASKESLRVLDANILPDPSAVQDVAGRKSERDRLLAEQHRIEGKQEASKNELDRLVKLSLIVDASCPTCDQEIDQQKLAQLVASVIAERDRLADEHERIVDALAVIGSAEEIKAAGERIEKHKKALTDKAEVAAKVEENEKALQESKAEAGKDFGGLFESSTFDTAISKTDEEIESILQQIQPVIAAEEREKDITTKKEQLSKLEDKADKLDKLVKLFDKDGIKAKLIATHIGGFEKKVNSVLSAWDYQCSLSIEPWRFEVTDYRKVSTPLIDLSGAEELMFYAAFQCAVSQVAGIGFVVIDRVDTLLPELRPMLFKKLYGMLTEKVLDQIILLIADTSEQVPKIPDSAFFKIDEGNIRRLG